MTHPVLFAMDTKFLQSLKTRCSETNEELDRRVADRQAELKAVIDAIGILNSDTFFDTFDKAVSTDFLQMSPFAGEQALRQRALSVLRDAMNTVVDDPVVQVPQMQVVEKTVEGPHLQIVEQIVETPETQTIQGIQTSESLDTAPLRQVHPTDVVKTDDLDAKLKFFVKEVLHGVGGFVFDAHGDRVANELGGQNCVTGEMWKNEPPFSLALNKATSDDIAWQCKHYIGRGVKKLHESGTALVEDMEEPVSKTPDSIRAHDQASLKTTRDPNGEPYPAFSSGKSWNEASGKTGSEKKFYHNVS